MAHRKRVSAEVDGLEAVVHHQLRGHRVVDARAEQVRLRLQELTHAPAGMGPTAGRYRVTWGQERCRHKLDLAAWGCGVAIRLGFCVAVRGMSILFGMAIGFVAVCGWFTEGHQVGFHGFYPRSGFCTSKSGRFPGSRSWPR